MSQSARLLKMLQKAGKKGIENHKFPKHGILRYSARIADLRKEGHDIRPDRVYNWRGKATGTYKYILRDAT